MIRSTAGRGCVRAPVRYEQAIEQTRFAHIGPPDDGEAQRFVVLLRCSSTGSSSLANGVSASTSSFQPQAMLRRDASGSPSQRPALAFAPDASVVPRICWTASTKPACPSGATPGPRSSSAAGDAFAPVDHEQADIGVGPMAVMVCAVIRAAYRALSSFAPFRNASHVVDELERQRALLPLGPRDPRVTGRVTPRRVMTPGPKFYSRQLFKEAVDLAEDWSADDG